MHNCKSSRARLIELAVDELLQVERAQVLADLKECALCRDEFASIRETLHLTNQALSSKLPSESFWKAYHHRLSERLQQRPTLPAASATKDVGRWQIFKNAFTASVRIPVPVAAAMLILFLSLGAFAWRAFENQPGRPVAINTPTVITKTVNVPVAQEKIVTRIVYRDRTRARARSDRLRLESEPQQFPGVASQLAEEPSDKPRMSLVGFKPTDRVKLQVMKGTYRHDQ